MANGLYTNTELIDTMIVDLNTLPKHLMDGQYVAFCGLISSLAQRLVNLKDGIKNDLDNRNQMIETLKNQLKEVGYPVVDVPVEEFLASAEKQNEE